MVEFNIPKGALNILKVLHDAHEEAYIVGGCVRDIVLGAIPYDWDITTSATPDKVKALFKRTIDTGIEHGTVTVMIQNIGYEVTTYRIDGDYEDFRHPKDVQFSSQLSEDLLRRDFTINAMAYNPYVGIVDLYGGLQDLEAKSIRCVGNPYDRFNEDALRMLRAIRFSAKLGFEIEPTTYQAITDLAHNIVHVSAERIQIEMTKTLISNQPEKIREMVNCHLIDHIFPEFKTIVGLTQHNPYHRKTVDEHIYESLTYVNPTPILRWTMYLHDIGKGFTKTTDEEGRDHFYGHQRISSEIANKLLKKLHFDNRTIEDVTKFVLIHDEKPQLTERSIRLSVSKIGIDYYNDYLDIREADIRSQSYEYMEEHLKETVLIREIFMHIKETQQCLTIKELAVNGRDIISLGIENGKIIGEILQRLLEFVLDEPKNNVKEVLLAKAVQLKSELC